VSIRKKAELFNLEKFEYDYIDRSPTSNRLFGIVDFPDKLTAGKNLFKIRMQNVRFVDNCKVYIDIVDYNGDPIYYEPLNYLEKDGTRVVAVYIYPETCPGVATVNVAARLERSIIETGVYRPGQSIPFSNDPADPNFYNIPNVLWQREVIVSPSSTNTTELIFTKQPSVTITEIVQPYRQPLELFNVFTEVSTSNSSVTITSQSPVSNTTAPAIEAPVLRGASAAAAVAGPSNPPVTQGQTSRNSPNKSVGTSVLRTNAVKGQLDSSAGKTTVSDTVVTVSGESIFRTTNFPLSRSMETFDIKVVHPIISAPAGTKTDVHGRALPRSQENEAVAQLGSAADIELSGSYVFNLRTVLSSTSGKLSQISGFKHDAENTFGAFQVPILIANSKAPNPSSDSRVSNETATSKVFQSTTLVITSFTATNVTASFIKPSEVIFTENSSSFADIIIADTEPKTGDVYRVKTLYKPSGQFGDFQDLGDTILEQQNILIDENAFETNVVVGSFYENFGTLESLEEINNYWSASKKSPSTLNPRIASITPRYDTDTLMGGIDMDVNWSSTVTNQYTAFNNSGAALEIIPEYRPNLYTDTTYVVSFKIATHPDIGLYSARDPRLKTPRLDIYVNGDITQDSPISEILIGNPSIHPLWKNTLTNIYRDQGPLGSRIGTIFTDTTPSIITNVQFQFTSNTNDPLDLKFVTRMGRFIISDIQILADKETGFSPNYVRVAKRIPTEHMNTPLTFKFLYFDTVGSKADLETFAYGAVFDGDNTYIEGTDNLLTGSVYIGNTINSGIELAGVSSGFIRSIGYDGFTNTKTGTSPGGFLIYSGSNSMTLGVDTYEGVGMQLVGDNDNSHFIFTTQNGGSVDIKAEKFFIGTTNTQFISGSGGNIEISSSIFHLDPQENKLIIGADAIINADLSVNQLFTPAGTTKANARSYISSSGEAGFSGDTAGNYAVELNGNGTSKIAGFEIDTTTIKSSTGAVQLKSSGQISASKVLFGDKATNQYVQYDGTNLVVKGDLSVDEIFTPAGTTKANARSFISSSGTAGFSGDGSGNYAVELDGNGTSKIAGFTIDSAAIKSSDLASLVLKDTGEITGSKVLLSGGRITGGVVIEGSVTANQIFTPALINGQASTQANASSSIDQFGFAKFASASIAGFVVNTEEIKSPLDGNVHNLRLKASGQVTGSKVQFDGGTIGGFQLSSTQINSTTNDLILKASGQVTGSKALFIGGKIGGFTMTPGQLSGGSGNTFIALIPQTGIQMGNETFSSAPFSVTNAGVLKATSGTIGGFTLGANTLTATNFELNPSGKRITLGSGNSIFIADGDEGIQLGHATFADAPFNVDLAGRLKATEGVIGGFGISSTKITGSNIVIDSAGSIQTSDYASDLKGWKISADFNGFAEFENAKIRGTLSTAVFEKETVNAVGGQLYVANSTALTSSAARPSGNYFATDATMSVVNVSGFSTDEILSLKKVSNTGFSTEYVKVISASRNNQGSETDLSGELFLTRGYGDSFPVGPSASLGDTPGGAQSYSGSQVIVSTGKIGTGYIRLNANPNNQATPYMDIVERTGSGVYDVDLKVRLGDLKGLANSKYVFGSSSPGFGLATTNVFLQGGIIANTGSIAGIKMESSKLFIGNGVHANSNTGFYVDSGSNFSLGNKLTWDGSALVVRGQLRLESGENVQDAINEATASNTAKSLILTTDSQIFSFASASSNVASPTAITVNIAQQNLSGVITPSDITIISGSTTITGFKVASGSVTVSNNLYSGISSGSLSYGAETTDGGLQGQKTNLPLTISVTKDGLTDSTTIFKVQGGSSGTDGTAGAPGAAGADAYTVFLTNESHTFPADASGNVSSNDLAAGATEVRVFKGTTQYTLDASAPYGTNTYRTSKTQTGITLSNNIVSNQRKFIPTGVSADTGTAVITIIDNAQGGATLTKTYSFSRADAGAAGQPGAAGAAGATGPSFSFLSGSLSQINTEGGLSSGLLMTSNVFGFHGPISAGDAPYRNATLGDFTSFLDAGGSFYLGGGASGSSTPSGGYFAWNNGDKSLLISGSNARVDVDKFFLGSTNSQFISGSNGNITISGDVDFQGLPRAGNVVFFEDWSAYTNNSNTVVSQPDAPKTDGTGIGFFPYIATGLADTAVKTDYAGQFTGGYLQVGSNNGSDYLWCTSNQLIPFNETSLYEVEIRAKVPQANGNPLFYAGFSGYRKDGVTKSNATGADTFSSVLYIAASGETKAELDDWKIMKGYLQGTASSNAGGEARDITSPAKAHSNNMDGYLAPVFIAGLSNQVATTLIDYIRVTEINNGGGSTRISGDAIKAGSIKSNNLSTGQGTELQLDGGLMKIGGTNAYASGNGILLDGPNARFAVGNAGGHYMRFNYTAGKLEINSDNFSVNSAGNVVVNGDITVTNPGDFALENDLPDDTNLFAYFPLAGQVRANTGYFRVLDFSGNNRNGNADADGISGGTTFVTGTTAGPVPGAAQFDGTDSVIHLDQVALDLTANMDISIAFWIKKTTTASQAVFGIHQASGNSALNKYIFFIDYNGGNNKVYLMINAVNLGEITTSSKEFTNTWRHVGIVAENGAQAKLYVDGELQGNFTNANVNTSQFANCDEMILGGELDSPGGAPTDDFSGYISEFRIYNSVLTANNMAALFNMPTGPPSSTNISGDRISTGKLVSANFSSTAGSEFDLDAGTFKLGGGSSPKLSWNGTTLGMTGSLSITNPEDFASGQSFAYDFTGNGSQTLDTGVWTLNNTKQSATTTGMQFGQNAGSTNWNGGIISNVGLTKADGLTLIMDFEVMNTSTSGLTMYGFWLPGSPLYPNGAGMIYSHGAHLKFYYKNTSGTMAYVTIANSVLIVGDSWRFRVKALTDGGFEYAAYKNGDFTAPTYAGAVAGYASYPVLHLGASWYGMTGGNGYSNFKFKSWAVNGQPATTTISGNGISTGILESTNLTTSAGSQFNLNDGTFKLGGTDAPNTKLEWDGTTLAVKGQITVQGGYNSSAGELFGNPTGHVLASDGRPGGWKTVYAYPITSNLKSTDLGDGNGSIVELSNASVNTIGIGSHAFPIEVQQNYKIKLTLKATANDANGLYIRIYEYDSELTGIQDTISHNAGASEAGTVEDTRNTSAANYVGGGWTFDNGGAVTEENGPITTSYVNYNANYIPTATAKYFSIIVLKWSGIPASVKLYVKSMNVRKVSQGTTISGAGISTGAIQSVTLTNTVGTKMDLDAGLIKIGGNNAYTSTNGILMDGPAAKFAVGNLGGNYMRFNHTAGKLEINAGNFSVDSDGAVTATDITLSDYAKADYFIYNLIKIQSGNYTDYYQTYAVSGINYTRLVLDGSLGGEIAQSLRIEYAPQYPIGMMLTPYTTTNAYPGDAGHEVTIEGAVGNGILFACGVSSVSSGYSYGFWGDDDDWFNQLFETRTISSVQYGPSPVGSVGTSPGRVMSLRSGNRFKFVRSANDFRLLGVSSFDFRYGTARPSGLYNFYSGLQTTNGTINIGVDPNTPSAAGYALYITNTSDRAGTTTDDVFTTGKYFATGLANVAGNAYVRYSYASGQISYTTSTRKSKQNILTPSSSIYNDVLNLEPKYFEYKQSADDNQYLGFIAEEAASASAHFATYGPDMDWNDEGDHSDPVSDRMVPVDIDERAIIASLVGKIQDLENRLKALEDQ